MVWPHSMTQKLCAPIQITLAMEYSIPSQYTGQNFKHPPLFYLELWLWETKRHTHTNTIQISYSTWLISMCMRSFSSKCTKFVQGKKNCQYRIQADDTLKWNSYSWLNCINYMQNCITLANAGVDTSLVPVPVSEQKRLVMYYYKSTPSRDTPINIWLQQHTLTWNTYPYI